MKVLNTLFAALLATFFVACNETPTNSVSSTTDTTNVETISFAYVDMDTVQSRYVYYQKCRAELEKVYNGYQATLAKKESSLQTKVAEFQKKAQENRFYSEEEFNKAQAVLASEQANLEQLSQKYMQQYAQQEMAMNKAINDSINNFLRDYNAEHKYTMILYKAVILHCSETLNITDEVIDGLNARYESGND